MKCLGCSYEGDESKFKLDVQEKEEGEVSNVRMAYKCPVCGEEAPVKTYAVKQLVNSNLKG